MLDEQDAPSSIHSDAQPRTKSRLKHLHPKAIFLYRRECWCGMHYPLSQPTCLPFLPCGVRLMNPSGWEERSVLVPSRGDLQSRTNRAQAPRFWVSWSAQMHNAKPHRTTRSVLDPADQSERVN